MKPSDNTYTVNLFEKTNIPYNLYSSLKKNFVTDESFYAITTLAIRYWNNTINDNKYSNFNIYLDKDYSNFTTLSNPYFSAAIFENSYPGYIIANHVLISIIKNDLYNITFCYITSQKTKDNGDYFRYIFILKKGLCHHFHP